VTAEWEGSSRPSIDTPAYAIAITESNAVMATKQVKRFLLTKRPERNVFGMVFVPPLKGIFNIRVIREVSCSEKLFFLLPF